jgi:hypothetical protein
MRVLVAAVCVLTMTVMLEAAEKAGTQDTNAIAESFALPKAWNGTKAGATNGNPCLVDNKPQWRADRLWPDNPLAGNDYVVMEWGESSWAAKDNSYGGRPSLSLGNDSVTLFAQAVAGGLPGAKIPVLIFIAPTSGTYKVQGVISAEVPKVGTSAPISLLIYKLRLKTKGKNVSKVEVVSLSHGKEQDLDKANIKLQTGDELAFVPQLSGAGFQANFTLRKLRIIRTQ